MKLSTDVDTSKFLSRPVTEIFTYIIHKPSSNGCTANYHLTLQRSSRVGLYIRP